MQPPAPGVPPEPGRSPSDPRAQSEPGYGWQAPPAYGGQPGPGYWGPTGPGYGGPPAYGQPGYGQFPYGPGGYQPPGGGPSGPQVAFWITLGIVIFLGLLGGILTLTLLLDISSAVSRASAMCNQYSGFSELCSHVKLPMAAVLYLVLMILGSLAVLAGALLMLLKKYFGQFLILGGGVTMALFAIICSAQFGGTGRITYDLIAGIFIAIAGGLLPVPQIRQMLGLPGNVRRPGQFGGYQPYGQPYPGQYGQPGSGGYPPARW